MADLKECMGPLWRKRLWDEINKNENLKFSNCYTYAFNYVDYGDEKLQPGEIHGTKYSKTTCKEIIRKMENDYGVNNIIKLNEDKDIKKFKKLPKGHYRIALFIDPDKKRKGHKDRDPDYHFYRQDCTGTWSHKPGTNDVSNEDASGNSIINPINSDRNYIEKCNRDNNNNNNDNEEDCDEKHNYTDFCGFFSIPLNSSYGPVIRYIDK